MAEEPKNPLKVFLCHAAGDKPQVRALYRRLVAEGVDAWLDQEKLLPGQNWRAEIPRAVREADVVVICLSNKSITKEGYVQKEIKFALDIAKEKPEGTIFLIPTRLEECIVPERLSHWQWVDLFSENGYEQLMRSLRLRADKIGATLEIPSFIDEPLAQRVDQLYTEGLAAFWVEDWDKACYCFQTILRYVPNDTQAFTKLEESQRQKNLNALYMQALDAQTREDWSVMVETLEKLTNEAADYKDVSLLLKDAQKKNRLARLYEEARKLHKAEQWQAVVRVFEHIAVIEPDFQDSDGLLPSAENKVAELKHLHELNNLYARAVREMDSGHWHEAYRLFKQIQDSEPAFLETERLMAKVKIEVKKAEEKQRREDQINTLYEQTRGLFRSQMWQEALNKIDEIRKLDEQFADPDQIAKQAQVEIELKEQEIERQNKLTDMYAEAVRLLRERKYQDALETWQEIVKIDPKYPDQHKVQITSKKKLAELTKSLQREPRLVNVRRVGITGLLIITLAVIIWGPVPVFNGFISSATPSLLPVTESPMPTATAVVSEFPIQIRILTSSDWTEVRLKSGGRFKDVKKLSSSLEASVADFNFTAFYLNQPLDRANGTNTVEMVVEAMLTNITPGTQLVLEGKRGCIGRTTIELSNAISEPVIVKTLTWGDSCSGDGLNLYNFEIPVDLFTE